MTRRWPQPGAVRRHFTLGDVIGTAIVALVLTIIFVCGFFFALATRPAHARDFGQWENTDPTIASWFRSLTQPDNPDISCCGEADAYWADGVEFKDGKTIAIITDDRPDEPLGRQHVPIGTKIEVPANKLKWNAGNPTGHIVIFLNVRREVYCYVQGSGI